MLIPAATPATASGDAVRWTEVNLPEQGAAGNWVLAEGSDIECLVAAPDGTLYAACRGLPDRLYKSGDSGLSWTATGQVEEDIVAIAVSPADAAAVYYTTSSAVYHSGDAGHSFQPLPPGPGGAGNNNVEITSLAVTSLNGNIIAVGTRDTDALEYGGVYILNEGDMSYTWTDSGSGAYDVYAVAFSPHYPQDGQLLAVKTDETDTYASVMAGSSGWDSLIGAARLSPNNAPSGSVAVTATAAIAFPDNYSYDYYSGNSVYYIAIDTGSGGGDVYRIVGQPGNSLAHDLNIGLSDGLADIDIAGLAASGNYPAVSLLAGASDQPRAYFSADGGDSWSSGVKNPTGQASTGVLFSPYYSTDGTVYAFTGGADSALSVSRDSGATWNQVSLIDNRIEAIVDLAPSPAYEQDNTLFMLTFGSGHSLWRSYSGGARWERLLSASQDGVDTLTLVSLPPQYDVLSPTVLVAGESDGHPAIWESLDDGQSYRCRQVKDPATGLGCAIDTWAIVNETTIFIGSYDGLSGRIYQTINSGFFLFDGATVGGLPLHSLALSPDFAGDSHILAGNTDGGIYWSADGGASFQSLPASDTSPLTGKVSVAFDPDYADNHTVYATVDTPGGGIYRFTIGTDTSWESIHDDPPAGAVINQLVSSEGALYAANATTGGGMERRLLPLSASTPFETVTRGLAGDATLYGLWSSSHRLWSVDTTNISLVTFLDTLTVPVVLVSPEDEAAGIGSLNDGSVRSIKLDWETLPGATAYEWAGDTDTDLNSVPTDLNDTTQASAVTLPHLEPATTYYWRVRASAPVVSPWSEVYSFTTVLDPEVNELKLESPVSGADDVPVDPLFRWTGIVGASAYELLVAASPDFSQPVISRQDGDSLPANAWQSDILLEYDTTYYWKVRAVNGSTRSDWSATGAFTTQSEPADGAVAGLTPTTEADPPGSNNELIITFPSPVYPPNTPPADASADLPDWAIYMIAGQAGVIFLALVTILVLVARKRRL